MCPFVYASQRIRSKICSWCKIHVVYITLKIHYVTITWIFDVTILWLLRSVLPGLLHNICIQALQVFWCDLFHFGYFPVLYGPMWSVRPSCLGLFDWTVIVYFVKCIEWIVLTVLYIRIWIWTVSNFAMPFKVKITIYSFIFQIYDTGTWAWLTQCKWFNPVECA